MPTDLPLPESISREIRGYDLHILPRLTAPTSVATLRKTGRPSLMLKIGSDLAPEEQRLKWLRGKFPVAEVVAFASQDGKDYLLMTKLPGDDGSDDRLHRDGTRFVKLLAHALHKVHDVPIADCPFQASTADLLDAAMRHVNQGLLRSENFPTHYLGRSPRELLQALHHLRPSDESAVFTHGDASLPNFMFHKGQVSGFIDLGLAGVADPYRDLALAARSLTRNMGGKWVRPFLQAYGAPLDHQRIEFFILLDEFIAARPG